MEKASRKQANSSILAPRRASLKKSGSWYSFGSERIGQGRENARAFLLENPDIANAIETEIRRNAGLIVDDMLAGPAIADDDEEAAAG